MKTISRERFPHLWNVEKPPEQFFYQGNEASLALLEELPILGFAVVGTRDPSESSRLLVRKWVCELARTRLIVISGFAKGIDTEAHFAATRSHLRTVAILGCGLNIDYPSNQSALRKSIIESGGLLISEFPPDAPAYASNFLHRNRLIAGWSQSVLVVEARAKSGALNTAHWARGMGIPVYATPNQPGNPRFLGNQILLEDEKATPFWGIHSLKKSWFEMATSRQTSDITALVQTARVFSRKGGATVERLQDWALLQNWSQERFFGALETALSLKRLSETEGLLENPE